MYVDSPTPITLSANVVTPTQRVADTEGAFATSVDSPMDSASTGSRFS
jgi:hypothetical protein